MTTIESPVAASVVASNPAAPPPSPLTPLTPVLPPPTHRDPFFCAMLAFPPTTPPQDADDDPTVEPVGSVSSNSATSSSSSDDGSASSTFGGSTATRGDKTYDDDDDDDDDDEFTDITPDLLTFQTLDDESDYESNLVFRKYHGPVADLGAPSTAEDDDDLVALMDVISAQSIRGRSNILSTGSAAAAKAAPGSGAEPSSSRFFPFWARKAAVPVPTPAEESAPPPPPPTTNSPSDSDGPRSLSAPAAEPTKLDGTDDDAPIPIGLNANADQGLEEEEEEEEEEDADNDSGSGIVAACFSRFECGGAGGTSSNRSSSNRGSRKDSSSSTAHDDGGMNQVKSPPPAPPPAVKIHVEPTGARDVAKGSTGPTTTEEGGHEQPQPLPTSPSTNKDDASPGLLFLPGWMSAAAPVADAAPAAAAATEVAAGRGAPTDHTGTAGPSAASLPSPPPPRIVALAVQHGITSAANAIDQTVEVMIGLCVPETQLSMMRHCSSHGGAGISAGDANVDDDDILLVPRDRSGTPTRFAFPPKVEVTAQDDGMEYYSYGGDPKQKVPRPKLIVSSTNEQLDETRVVTIVGMDELSHSRRKQRGGPWLKRLLRRKAAASQGATPKQQQQQQQKPTELERARDASRQRSLLSTRSLDDSSRRRRNAARRPLAKHSRLRWIPRPSTFRFPGIGANGGGGDDDDDEEEEDDRSFQSRSTLSSYLGDSADDHSGSTSPRKHLGLFGRLKRRKEDSEAAVDDLDAYSLCSVDSFGSLASQETLAWLWALVPIHQLRSLSRAVGLEADSDGEEGGNVTDDKDRAAALKSNAQSPVGEDGLDGTSDGVQIFAPVHVKKGEVQVDEVPPPPHISAIGLLSAPAKGLLPTIQRRKSRLLTGRAPTTSNDTASAVSKPPNVEDRSALEEIKGWWDSAASFVTEDERTVTDGDSSIHTIRILRIPVEQLALQQLPLPPPRPLPPPPAAPSAVVVSQKDRKQPRAQSSASSWQPGLSARPRPNEPNRSPRGASVKARSLADDLSHHESDSHSAHSAPHVGAPTLRPFQRRGTAGEERELPPRSPRLRSRRFSFRSPAAASSPTPVLATPPRSDRTPLLPKLSSLASPNGSSPTASSSTSRSEDSPSVCQYSTPLDEVITTTTTSADEQPQGFLTTTLRIRRVPTSEIADAPSTVQ
jgi:hypothetical protein